MSASARLPLALQGLVLLGATVLLALAPPAEGNLLLVPLRPGAAARMLPLALARGARLVAPGPLPASMVVWGRRGALLSALAHAGIVVMAAPAAACGEEAGGDGER